MCSVSIIDTFIHKTLRRPYRLAVSADQGKGAPVVLLHGIASSGKIWNPLLALPQDKEVRYITFDLLGFGQSPKPEWATYDVASHARSVEKSIRALRLKEPIVLVGHSMGCLIAAHIAFHNPQLVRRLVLFEPPLLAEVSGLKRYNRRKKAYMRAFGYIASRQELVLRYSRYMGRWANRMTAFSLDDSEWVPFERSLRNTIMEQKAYEELHAITIPTDVIYGRSDLMVIRTNAKQLFAANPHIRVHTILEGHGLSARSAAFIHRLITS